MRPLLEEAPFRIYRRFRERHSEDRRYTEPFIPLVGGGYEQAPRRFVYCGAAIWERELENYSGDEIAFEESSQFTRRHLTLVGEGKASSTAFWRLFDDASKIALGAHLDLKARTNLSVWTNLSKLGEEGLSSPRDVNGELQRLDVSQLGSELKQLQPEIVLCVSGSALEKTGYAVFGSWPRLSAKLESKQTEVRRMPNGGFLLWTMHPNRKSEEWKAALLRDLRMLVLAEGK